LARAYYNDNDAFVCAWLRELIADGLIMDGDVDLRSIKDVQAQDLEDYTRCHFFAGIGGWDYALQLAGWPVDRPVWTGSCPCQPLSVAGLGKGDADERHLWPAFHDLITKCGPTTVFGEQVAGKDGREWLAGVRADLESGGYACGSADLCAAGVGAPHIRQRLYWVAKSDSGGRGPKRELGELPEIQRGRPDERLQIAGAGSCGGPGGMADSSSKRRQQDTGSTPQNETAHGRTGRDGSEQDRDYLIAGHSANDSGMGDTGPAGLQDTEREVVPGTQRDNEGGATTEPGRASWADSTFIDCRDGKRRRIPVEPALFPLADGISNRVDILRGAGNSIVPQVAAQFIGAFLEIA